MAKMGANGGTDGGKFLQTPRLSEAEHRKFPSWKRQMRILCPIVQAAARILTAMRAKLPQCRSTRAQVICNDHRKPTVVGHCFLKELQRRLPAAHLCDEAFQDFAFMLDRPPKIMLLADDLDEYLVQMPLPVWA
jgi:hypothetical protein